MTHRMTRPGRITEAHVARACDHLASQLGWTVERYEQGRATRIAEGLPDRRYVLPLAARVWVELKAPDGKLTRRQHEWLNTEAAAGGLACALSDPATLAPILHQARHHPAAATDLCQQATAAIALRGYRRETQHRPARARKGAATATNRPKATSP
jgi:hypothetical protein